MPDRVKLLGYSMLAQMALISFLFLGGFIFFIIAQPAMESYDRWQQKLEESQSSLPNTAQELVAHIYDYYWISVKDNQAQPEDIFQQGFIQKVTKENPDFTLLIHFNQKRFSNTNKNLTLPPHLKRYREFTSNNFDIIGNKDSICNSIRHSDQNANLGLRQYFFARQCHDINLTVEFTGLTSPVSFIRQDQTAVLPQWVWNLSQDTIFAALGMFAIMSVVLIFNLRFIQRLTTVAKTFDFNSDTNQPLPEKGLPIEVLPLVRAVNQMVEKVKKTKEKHDFFLSAAAHEMRTPLTILRTRLAVLEDSPAKKLLENDIRRIIDMVNQLLMLMRSSTPQKLGRPIYLSMLCQKVISNVRPLFDEKGVKLEVDIIRSEEKLLGDQQLLETAVLNLLENALSFSEAGDCVRISLDKKSRIHIKDQGPGIDPDRLDNIFTPFSKFPPNRRGHHGLGLAIVKAIVSIHYGKVSAHNYKDGAAFVMDFSNKKR